MSWLDTVRPKLRRLVKRNNFPENLWRNCPSCSQLLYHAELAKNQSICHHCGHHLRQDPMVRFSHLFDDGRYSLLELPTSSPDPLKFKDSKKYTSRIEEARDKTEMDECVLVADGHIDGERCVALAMNFEFMGGSMGRAMGDAFIEACRLAVTAQTPFICFTASGGARMQEGILSLMQMARTTAALEDLRDQGLPYIVVLTDPTTGGVSASFAMLGDVHIAEPGARIGFAGARVIEQTVREQLPEGFQRAEYLRDHGMVDMVVHRHDLRAEIGKLVKLFMDARRQAVKWHPEDQLSLSKSILEPLQEPNSVLIEEPPLLALAARPDDETPKS